MGIRCLFLAGIAVTLCLSAGCGNTKLINTATLPDNTYCQYMKDICKEAREFEAAYEKLTPNERKDAENILKAYRLQCNDAINACRKSAEKP